MKMSHIQSELVFFSRTTLPKCKLETPHKSQPSSSIQFSHRKENGKTQWSLEILSLKAMRVVKRPVKIVEYFKLNSSKVLQTVRLS